MLLGRDAVFVLNALSFLASAWLIRRMQFRASRTPRAVPRCARATWWISRRCVEGFRYIRADRAPVRHRVRQMRRRAAGRQQRAAAGSGRARFPGAAWPGFDAAPRRHAGDEPADGRARRRARCSGRWSAGAGPGDRHARLRTGILFGFLLAAAGYLCAGRAAPRSGWPCRRWSLAHAGGSTNWVFSTTLLQIHTEDRFRGRVFAAELGLFMLTHLGQQLPGGRGARPGRAGAPAATASGRCDAAAGRRLGIDAAAHAATACGWIESKRVAVGSRA